MKAVIKKVLYNKEVQTKFGVMHNFKVYYNDREASFLSKSKDQNYFVEGKEAEFVESEREYNGQTYYNVKPQSKGNSGYSRKVQQEQSRYSGFSMSYAKDLVVSGKIELSDMAKYAELMFNWMVNKDNELNS